MNKKVKVEDKPTPKSRIEADKLIAAFPKSDDRLDDLETRKKTLEWLAREEKRAANSENDRQR